MTKRWASVCVALAAFAAAAPLRAETSAAIKLGDIPRYADEASARAGCGADPVVWADRKSGFFYPAFHPDYGKTSDGAFTCFSRAKKADYWSLVPDGDFGPRGPRISRVFLHPVLVSASRRRHPKSASAAAIRSPWAQAARMVSPSAGASASGRAASRQRSLSA